MSRLCEQFEEVGCPMLNLTFGLFIVLQLCRHVWIWSFISSTPYSRFLPPIPQQQGKKKRKEKSRPNFLQDQPNNKREEGGRGGGGGKERKAKETPIPHCCGTINASTSGPHPPFHPLTTISFPPPLLSGTCTTLLCTSPLVPINATLPGISRPFTTKLAYRACESPLWYRNQIVVSSSWELDDPEPEKLML